MGEVQYGIDGRNHGIKLMADVKMYYALELPRLSTMVLKASCKQQISIEFIHSYKRRSALLERCQILSVSNKFTNFFLSLCLFPEEITRKEIVYLASVY